MSESTIDGTGDGQVMLRSLFVHPIKSCAGIAVDEALLVETGLELDRAWMVVDEAGEMLTQRELPRMALIQPTLRGSDMVLRAPGMLALHVLLDTVEAADPGAGVGRHRQGLRHGRAGGAVVQRFPRPARCGWCASTPSRSACPTPPGPASIEAENAFADAFPLLVVSAASLDDLNARLVAKRRGAGDDAALPAQPGARRPAALRRGPPRRRSRSTPPQGPVRLRLVKPCVRCTIPNVDPASGAAGHEPGDTLAGYRADAAHEGRHHLRHERGGAGRLRAHCCARGRRRGWAGASTDRLSPDACRAAG